MTLDDFFYGKYFGNISDSANSKDTEAQMNTEHQICSGPIVFFETSTIL